MSGAMREKLAADFDLERFVDLFDQALTSDDPRVKNALRQLMMMVVLTDTDDHEGKQRSKHGPLRSMQQDMREQFRWIQRLEQEIEKIKQSITYNQMQQPNGPGYRAQDYGIKYTDNTSGQMVNPNDYWNSVIAQKHPSPTKIPASTLQNLNIQIATDTGDADA